MDMSYYDMKKENDTFQKKFKYLNDISIVIIKFPSKLKQHMQNNL